MATAATYRYTQDHRFRNLPDKCTVCKSTKTPFCTKCNNSDNKERRLVRVKKSHCTTCCRYCDLCHKWGHQTSACLTQYFCNTCEKQGHTEYRQDGSIWCRKLITCDICKIKGHDDSSCHNWCEICRYDGSGDKWIGHSTIRCFKNED